MVLAFPYGLVPSVGVWFPCVLCSSSGKRRSAGWLPGFRVPLCPRVFLVFCAAPVARYPLLAGCPDSVCLCALVLSMYSVQPQWQGTHCRLAAWIRCASLSLCFTGFDASVSWKHVFHWLWRIRIMEACVLRALAHASYRSKCFTGFGASV